MPSFRMAGGQCCCCRDVVRTLESRYPGHYAGTGGSCIKRRASSPSRDTADVGAVNWRPVAASPYRIGVSCADWRNDRWWGTYNRDDTNPSNVVIDTNLVFATWDAKDYEQSTGRRDQFELSSVYADALCADSRNSRLLFSGAQYPHPQDDVLSLGFSLQLMSVNFDGSGLTVHDEFPVFDGTSPGASLIGWQVGLGSLCVHHPVQRLYYTKVDNIASPLNPVASVCYRPLGNLAAETVLYEHPYGRLGTELGFGYIRGIGSISFDMSRQHVYWVETFIVPVAGANRTLAKCKRMGLNGEDEETIYTSTDPHTINLVRYSNKLGKIIHQDFDRRGRFGHYLGTWERNPEDWNDAKLVGLSDSPDITGGPFFASSSPVLWCGYEATGPSAVL